MGLFILILKDSLYDIAEGIQHVSGRKMLAIMCCSILYNGLDGAAITVFMKRYKEEFKLLDGISCSFYYSFFRVVTMGSGTAAAGMYYVNGCGVPAEKSFGAFTLSYAIQRVVCTLYFLLAFLIGAPYMQPLYQKYQRFILIGMLLTILIAGSLIVMCVSKRLHSVLLLLMHKIGKDKNQDQKIRQAEEKLQYVRQESISLLWDTKVMGKIIGLDFLKYSAVYLVPGILFGAQNITHWLLSICIISMVTALSGVIPAPGGRGSTEALFLLLFSPLTGHVQAASAMILYSFITFLFPGIIGGLFVIGGRRKMKKQEEIDESSRKSK